MLDDNRPRLELNPDRSLGVDGELIPRKSRQDLGLPDCRIADEHHLEDIVDLAAASRHRDLERVTGDHDEL